MLGWGNTTATKGYHGPPAGGSGAKDPRTVATFHFLQRCKVLENESSFQKYQHFLPAARIHFPKSNFEKSNIFTGISKIFRIFISKFSILMNPINPEKFSVNSLIWLRNLQWRQHDFFREPTPRPIKGYQAPPPQGVRGDEGPRTVAKFHFLKRFKISENEFIFQKCQHFSSPKDPSFLRKI